MKENSIDPDKFRQEVEETLKDHRSRAARLAAAVSDTEKTEALYHLHYLHPEDAEAGARALAIATSRKEGRNLRIRALQVLGNYLHGRPSAIRKVIGLVAARRDETPVRRAALDTLLSIRFYSPAFQSQTPYYRKALQSIVHDRDPDLSAKAIEQLAGYGDKDVLGLLEKGLQEPAAALVPDAKAIQLLGMQHTGGFSAVITQHLKKSREPGVLIEAIHALSGDPAAQDDIQQILENKAQYRYVRLAGLAALNATAPGKFLASAKKIIADPADYSDVKIAALNAIAIHGRYGEVAGDPDFMKQVRALSGHDNELLRTESLNFLAGNG